MPRPHSILLSSLILLSLGGCLPKVLTERGGVSADGGEDADRSAGAALVQGYLEQRASTGDEVAAYRPWVAVLPFEDDSGFREGVWDLDLEVPRMLSSEMEGIASWRVVPFAVVEEAVGGGDPPWKDAELRRIGGLLQAEVLARGVLLDYNMERLHVGDPLIGGYKSYKGVSEMEVHLLRVADLTRVGSAHSRQEVIDRGLGLDLLGKPRRQDYQFANLGEMTYGSEEFRSTAIGQATVQSMEELLQKAAPLLRPAVRTDSGAAEILSVSGSEIFINIGSENGVHPGYRFAVYPAANRDDLDPHERIAVVEVREIIGTRVSKVAGLSGAGPIGAGDRIELILSPEPPPSSDAPEEPGSPVD